MMENKKFLEFTKCTSCIRNRMEKDLYLIGVGYVNHRYEHSQTHRHIKPYYTIHFVVSGKGFLEVENKKYEIGEYEIFALPDKVPMRYYPDKENPWEYIFFEFHGDLSQQYLNDANFSLENPVRKCAFPQKILLEFSDYFKKLHAQGSVSYHESYATFSMLLASTEEQQALSPSFDEENFVLEVKNFIIHYCLEPHFSAEYVAENMHVSHSYLCKIFKKYTGETLISFIKQQKMQTAEHLLKESDWSIYEISYMSGFNNYPHFLTAFKEMHGITAKQYRNLHQTKKNKETPDTRKT